MGDIKELSATRQSRASDTGAESNNGSDRAYERQIRPLLKRLKSAAGPVMKLELIRLEERLQQILRTQDGISSPTRPDLTPREKETCRFITKGLSSKEIASLASVSEEAIRARRKNIRRKLGLMGSKISLRTYLQQHPSVLAT